MATLILVILAVLILDAFVSAAEAAIYSVPLHRAKLIAEKSRTGKILLSLKESMELPITTLISLSNLITIIGSVFVGVIASRFLGGTGVGIFAFIFTVLVMIFAEILPKRLGERFAEPFALFAAPMVLGISKVFSPISRFVVWVTKPLVSVSRKTTSEEEIEFLADLAQKEGAIEQGESQMIRRVFHLKDITAADIMTPLQFVDFIDGAKTVGGAAELIKTTGHSRLPVYEGDKNNIVGIVHQRNLLRALANNELDRTIKDYIWDAMIVPDSRLADDLLRDMKDKRAQLAIVVSDYGHVVGVVGIEDILEELVGEIIDEKDVAPDFIKRVSRNEIIVHGQTQISHINHFFNTEIKSRRKNLNGFLMEQVGELPKEGRAIDYKNLKFVVEAVGPQAIERVRIMKMD